MTILEQTSFGFERAGCLAQRQEVDLVGHDNSIKTRRHAADNQTTSGLLLADVTTRNAARQALKYSIQT